MFDLWNDIVCVALKICIPNNMTLFARVNIKLFTKTCNDYWRSLAGARDDSALEEHSGWRSGDSRKLSFKQAIHLRIATSAPLCSSRVLSSRAPARDLLILLQYYPKQTFKKHPLCFILSVIYVMLPLVIKRSEMRNRDPLQRDELTEGNLQSTWHSLKWKCSTTNPGGVTPIIVQLREMEILRFAQDDRAIRWLWGGQKWRFA